VDLSIPRNVHEKSTREVEALLVVPRLIADQSASGTATQRTFAELVIARLELVDFLPD
jgi:hypothetical protein